MTSLFSAAQTIRIEPAFAAWREAARPLLQQNVPPEAVHFIDTDSPSAASLFAPQPQATQSATRPRTTHVPQAFLRRAETVACHRSPTRWNILYRLLWRLQSNRNLMQITVDNDMAAFRRLEQQVHHDLHKMHAFVRFRRVDTPDGEAYIAWYEPAHLILPLAAPFFAERFAIMRWSILTPDGCLHWDPQKTASPKQVVFTPGVSKELAPKEDELEDLWLTYYGSIFNPARTNLRAMRSEMPMRFWKNLPEMQIMPDLLAQAGERVATMIERQSTLNAESWVPKEHTLPILQDAIPRCQGCELHRCATQAVFGAGPQHAQLMLVGEQPGDEEDLSGKPFVGPAGRLLDQLLAEAEIDRSTAYVTNAVKHFKFRMVGNLRYHRSPSHGEINACRPWLLAELDAIQPRLILCLGASATKSLLGAKFSLTRDRGKIVSSPWASKVIATFHPSAILRATDPQHKAEIRTALLTDLKLAKAAIEGFRG